MIQQDITQTINTVVAQLKGKYSDITPVLHYIAKMIEGIIANNFDQLGRWDGSGTNLLSGGDQRWEPLAESTKAR